MAFDADYYNRLNRLMKFRYILNNINSPYAKKVTTFFNYLFSKTYISVKNTLYVKYIIRFTFYET